MNIAIYAKTFKKSDITQLNKIIEAIINNKCVPFLWKDLYDELKPNLFHSDKIQVYSKHFTQSDSIDFMLSIGGDGTILDTVQIVRDSNIPIAGINLGNMGFLASIKKNEIADAIAEIFNKKYNIQKRTLLKVESDKQPEETYQYAINEISIAKKDTGSMILNHVWLDNKYIHSFRADGLIIATPTGSTAYSLSCNGPIVTPDSNIFLLTPIAPHNLSVRPVVIPDNSLIKIQVESRENMALVCIDNHSYDIDNETIISIKKADFTIQIIERLNENFFSTLRTKLNWGIDIRN